MSHLSELKQLVGEDNTLKEIANKLNEQLTRLKVEEMALTSWIKMRDNLQIRASSKETASPCQQKTYVLDHKEEDADFEPNREELPHLDLTVEQDQCVSTDEYEQDDDYTAGDLENLTSFLINQAPQTRTTQDS